MARKITQSLGVEIALFAFALLFCAYCAQRLVLGGKDSAIRKPAATEEASPERAPALERSPASLADESALSHVLELGCIDRIDSSKTWKVSAGLTRISAEFCGKERAREGSGRNTANGAEILTLFERNSRKIATSYFPVEPGRNTIEIEWKSGSKAQKTRIEVIREP